MLLYTRHSWPHGSVVKKLPANAGDAGDVGPCVRKNPWRRKWQPTPVFFPRKFHGQGLWCATIHRVAKSEMRVSDWVHTTHTHTHTHTHNTRHCLEMEVLPSFCKKKKKRLRHRMSRQHYQSCIAHRWERKSWKSESPLWICIEYGF